MLPPPRVPSLAQRVMELRNMQLPGAQVDLHAGAELRYWFEIAPSAFGRMYSCQLRMKPDSRSPEVFVLAPDLQALAGDARLPHIYPHRGAGTKLCLWWPRRREWVPQLKLAETCLPWTAEWLWYFEDWLTTGVWAGGGEHPTSPRRRWARAAQPRAFQHA